jgi:hypothetical protein
MASRLDYSLHSFGQSFVTWNMESRIMRALVSSTFDVGLEEQGPGKSSMQSAFRSWICYGYLMVLTSRGLVFPRNHLYEQMPFSFMGWFHDSYPALFIRRIHRIAEIEATLEDRNIRQALRVIFCGANHGTKVKYSWHFVAFSCDISSSRISDHCS